jgi:uncharacterized protein (TIGR03435 family)
MSFQGSRLVAVNNNLFTIMRSAWAIQPNQIVGGPDWVRSDGERFDITAKAPDGTPPPQMRLMLQALLADRFTLKIHRETRDLPIYALVLARPDGKLGPQITPASFDCKALVAAINRGERVTMPPPNGEKLPCIAKSATGRILAGGTAFADFASILSNFVGGRPVVDRTGLSGDYEFDLTWTPEVTPSASLQSFIRFDPNGPSLFTAVQEQLGLKLESTTGPVEVLVIDSADRPTPD